jgi:hypothetical protein
MDRNSVFQVDGVQGCRLRSSTGIMVIVWLLRGLAFSVSFIRHHVYLFLLFSLELRQSTDELSTSILRIRANSGKAQKDGFNKMRHAGWGLSLNPPGALQLMNEES